MRKSYIETLRAVYQEEPCTVSELAKRMGKPVSTARGRMNNLEAEGLVVYEKDSTPWLFSLTPAGRRMLTTDDTLKLPA